MLPTSVVFVHLCADLSSSPPKSRASPRRNVRLLDTTTQRIKLNCGRIEDEEDARLVLDICKTNREVDGEHDENNVAFGIA